MLIKKHLTIISISLILNGIFINPLLADHFVPVWTGNPFNPMAICVTEALIAGNDMLPGDEIGIFDGEFCVGSGLLTQIIDPLNNSTFLYIACSMDDPDTPEIDGYTEGQTIIYKVWDQSANVEIEDVAHTFPYAPNFVFETFSQNETAIVALAASLTYSASGTIKYPNGSQTPLAGLTVNLKDNSGAVIATISTNSSGFYSFTGLVNGTYTLDVLTSKPWGGVSALDVLLYKKHIANVAYLSGIFLASGDVNGSGSLTASDVLLIKKRIAFVTNSFPLGDWLFNDTPIIINGNNVVQDFYGICYGDANGSYSNP